MISLVYRVLAELVTIVHVLVGLFLVAMFYRWEEWFWYYGLVLFLGCASWAYSHRCFLTDLELYLRDQAGQDRTGLRDSFTGYWCAKIMGEQTPSDWVISMAVGTFFILGFAWWLVLLFLYIW